MRPTALQNRDDKSVQSEAERSFVSFQVNEASAHFNGNRNVNFNMDDVSMSGSATYPDIGTNIDTNMSINPNSAIDMSMDMGPPHFDVEATQPASKRRSFGGAILRRLAARVLPSNPPPSEEEEIEEEGGTTRARVVTEEEGESGITVIRTGNGNIDLDVVRNINITHAGEINDSEFGTGFLNVESNPSATLSSVGCCINTNNANNDNNMVEATAEAELTVSALTSYQRDGGYTSGNSAMTASSCDSNSGGSTNLARFARRARRALRRGSAGNATAEGNGGTYTAPDNMSLSTMTINGEKQIVLIRELTKKDLQDDLCTMKKRFQKVPFAEGNPPWLTRYHPDLVREPSSPLIV